MNRENQNRKRIVIIGAVAAGPKAASRIKRICPNAEVTVVERNRLISFAGCGLPYFVADTVKEESELRSTALGVVRDPTYFDRIKDFKVLTRTEALSIDRESHQVRVRSIEEDREYDLPYDHLILCTGAKPVWPPLPGIELDGVFRLHQIEDAEKIRERLQEKPLRVTLVGGGLIGVEMAEALASRGCEVTIVEMLDHILPILDGEMAALVEKYLKSKGIRILTRSPVRAIEGEGKVESVVAGEERIDCDMAIVSIGVKPNVALAEAAGLEIGTTGAIRVDQKMQSSDPDIFAAGDCCETYRLPSGEPCHVPLGSTANKQGRVAANNICGVEDSFPGILGAGACRVFDYNIARTGLTEAQAEKLGYHPESTIVVGPDKPHFMPNANPIFLKLIVDRDTEEILGAQAIGPGDCVKRIDEISVAITSGMKLRQLAQVDLCYSPPFSPPIDNTLTAVNVLENKIDGLFRGVKSTEIHHWLQEQRDFVLLDVRTPQEYEQMHLPDSTLLPLGKVRAEAARLPKDKPIVVFCKVSLRGYEAARMLHGMGFEDVYLLEGGIAAWPYELEEGAAMAAG